jgi:1-acyl-sn-glycerol-3-phosphate acyltransferase
MRIFLSSEGRRPAQPLPRRHGGGDIPGTLSGAPIPGAPTTRPGPPSPTVWLLPVFSQVSALALRVFYRFEAGGQRVPERGPALLVANHPNSLLDPAMVVSVARRPVRFLAKAPLFTDALVGWLIRGSGSIPVYRKTDDPAAMGQNENTFRAVHDALAAGAAVGIFPEGTSHSEPALVPLKTGAARIALGAAQLLGGAFPIVPVGLSLPEKETFRSDAFALVGSLVEWDDLAHAGEDDVDAVRELTRRIDEALHDVTVNLARWEDAPLVETAEAVFAAEHAADPSPARRVAGIREITGRLADLRARGGGDWTDLARDVRAHGRLLRVLGMRPDQLAGPDAKVAAAWVFRQLAFFLLGAPAAAIGIVLFYLPYRLTGVAEARARPERDVRATYKLLMGGIFHVAWTLLLAGLAAWRWGWIAGLAALVALPAVAFVTVLVADRWERATGEARRFFLRARRRETILALRQRQRDLAVRIGALREHATA